MELRDFGRGEIGLLFFITGIAFFVGHALTVGWKNSFDDFGKLVLFLAVIGFIFVIIGIWESKKEGNSPQL